MIDVIRYINSINREKDSNTINNYYNHQTGVESY